MPRYFLCISESYIRKNKRGEGREHYEYKNIIVDKYPPEWLRSVGANGQIIIHSWNLLDEDLYNEDGSFPHYY